MKLNTALIFVVILVAITAVIGAGAYVVNLFSSPQDTPAEKTSTDFFSALFPFGNGGSEPETRRDDQIAGDDSRPVPQLRRVSENRAAGGILTDDGKIRFVEKETGYVYETDINSYTTVRLSNTTMPGIQEAVWVDGERVILRMLNENDAIQNILGTIRGTTTEQSLTARGLPGFSRIALSKGGKSALTVTENLSGSRVELVTFDGAVSSRVLLSSPVRSWVPRFGGTDLFLQTAASEFADGFLYKLEGQTLTKVTGGSPGLTAKVSPSGRYVLYGSVADGAPYLFVLDRSTGESYEMPTAAMPEKCAWFPEEESLIFCGVSNFIPDRMPDAWFAGAVALEDSAWVIDPIRRVGSLVLNLSEQAGTAVDMTNPTVNTEGTHALFTNKNDSSLWVLDLRPATKPSRLILP